MGSLFGRRISRMSQGLETRPTSTSLQRWHAVARSGMSGLRWKWSSGLLLRKVPPNSSEPQNRLSDRLYRSDTGLIVRPASLLSEPHFQGRSRKSVKILSTFGPLSREKTVKNSKKRHFLESGSESITFRIVIVEY